MHAYLDGCLTEPATKALLVQSRTEAGLTDLVAGRNQSAAALMMPDLLALGWVPPEPIAALRRRGVPPKSPSSSWTPAIVTTSCAAV